MAYTSTVPQGNQSIAFTQPIIQANFGFLPVSIGTEHNFNASGTGSDTYHLRASMPNQADPIGTLPAGTNGQYYVSAGVPKFCDNTTASFIQLVPSTATIQKVLTGVISVTTSLITPGSITLPNDACGNFFLIPTSISSTTGSAMGQFSTAGSVIAFANNNSPHITLSSSGLNLLFVATSGSAVNNYKYLVVYYTP